MKKSLLQMHAAVLLWGFTGVLGRQITLDAPVLVWYRMLLTAVFMAVILFYRKQWVKISTRDMLQLIVVGCLIGLHWVAFYAAIKFANVSIALVCLSTASVFTSLLDPLVNKGKYDLKEMALGTLALVGVYLIYSFQVFYATGIVLGVIAAILSSVFTVLNKGIASKYPSRTMVFWEMLSGWGLISIAIGVMLAMGLEKYLVSPDRVGMSLQLLPTNGDWIWLVLLSLCCTVWAQSLALSALKKLSSFTVTLSVNLEPVYGIILAFIFFHENNQLHPGFFIGMGLICLSVVLQMFRLIKPSMSPGFVKEKGGLD
ncbi:DMT family transporter [Taibaiella soli]|nr:DMT family transporter [Taibaiella soli]